MWQTYSLSNYENERKNIGIGKGEDWYRRKEKHGRRNEVWNI